VASAFGGGDAPAGGAEPSQGASDQARRKPSPVPAADGPPAIGAGPAAATSEPGSERSAEAATGLDPAVTAESMNAMLAAAVPGVSFGDPLGSADPLSAGDYAPADEPAVPPEWDASSANGSEAAG